MSVYLLIILLIIFSFVINKMIYKHEITWKESIAIIIVPIIIFSIFWLFSIRSKTSDYLVINGFVQSKSIDKVHCRHSYSCNCYTSCSGSGKNRSCSRHCQTCYEHSYDNDYVIHSNIGNFYISTIDRQGLKVPQRYTETIIGEPVSKTKHYVNYIKGSRNTIFKASLDLSKEELSKIPKYPLDIYDYWKLDRVIDTTGFLTKDQLYDYNEKLSNFLKTQKLGKEHNVVIIYTIKPISYANIIISSWFGGKKNDIIIIIGTNSSKQIEYVKIHSWSMTSLFDISLRDDIKSSPTIYDFDHIINSLDLEINQSYLLRSFKEFEYLKYQILPSNLELICYILLSLTASFVMSYFLGKPQTNF